MGHNYIRHTSALVILLSFVGTFIHLTIVGGIAAVVSKLLGVVYTQLFVHGNFQPDTAIKDANAAAAVSAKKRVRSVD